MSVRLINLDTEFRPLLDEVINVRRTRVFNDGSGLASLWYELEPGLCWCGYSKTDAENTRSRVPQGVSLDTLRGHYGSRLTPA